MIACSLLCAESREQEQQQVRLLMFLVKILIPRAFYM